MIDELEKRIASARKSLNHAEHERRETGATGRAPARGKSYEELLAALREICTADVPEDDQLKVFSRSTAGPPERSKWVE